MCFYSGSTSYSHKSVQKLFHNLHIIFSNSLMGFKVICHLEKEPLKGLANVQEIFSKTISLVIDLQWRCQEHLPYTHFLMLLYDRFLPELWPFVSFSHFINRSSCLRNSSYSFQGIFMKLSRYYCHDLKMRICYRGHAQLIFTRVMAL